MIALAFSILCMILAWLYSLSNNTLYVITFVIASIIWYILFIINSYSGRRLTLMENYFKGGNTK